MRRTRPPVCRQPRWCTSCSPLRSLLGVARTELALTRYLVGELIESPAARLRTLAEFVPLAEAEDGEPITAGRRVQVIKRDPATKRGPRCRRPCPPSAGG